MQDTTGSIISFIERLFSTYMMLIQQLTRDGTLDATFKYLLIGAYSLFLIIILVLLYCFLKLLLELIARGVSALFVFITDALKDPRSIPYIGILVLVRSVPWYFSLLLIILVFCGIAALITGSSTWAESFKYILGATVGSLIGVVKKKEEVEFEQEVFRSVVEPTPPAAGPNRVEVVTNNAGKQE